MPTTIYNAFSGFILPDMILHNLLMAVAEPAPPLSPQLAAAAVVEGGSRCNASQALSVVFIVLISIYFKVDYITCYIT